MNNPIQTRSTSMHNEGAVTAITAKRLTLALVAAGAIGGAVGAISVNHNSAVAAPPSAPLAPLAAAAPVSAAAPVAAPVPVAAGVMLPDFTQLVAHNSP